MPSLSFGLVVLPQSEALARFHALASWMRAHAGLDLASRPAPTYEALARSVREGSTDVAWLPPVAYAWLAEGVTPVGSLVRAGKTTYAGALVVRADSPLRALADLSKVRAGWADPWSAAGYVVPRLELARAGISPRKAFAKETFYGSHERSLAALAEGDCDVVGTYEGAWIGDAAVRAIATFASIPADVVAVRRNLAPVDYDAVVRAFRVAHGAPEARALAQDVFGSDELREGVDPGHDALRRAYESGIANGLFD